MQQPPSFATTRRVGCIMWLAIVALSLSVIGLLLDITQEMAWNQRVEQALAVAPTLFVEQPQSEPAPTGNTQATGPTFEAVCKPDTNNMTDPQIASFAEQWVGQRIGGWQGWVYDVSSRTDGTFNLEIAMEERGLLWTRDVVLENIDVGLANRLNVEQVITFSGRIARNEATFEVLCNPLVIEDYNVQE